MAQSTLGVRGFDRSTRRSTYQSLTDRTMVSVFSKGGAGGHRSEMRVERRDSDFMARQGEAILCSKTRCEKKGN